MDFGISKDASATSPTRPQKICRARGPARTLLPSARSTAGLKDHLVAPIRFRDGAFPAALLRRRVRILGAVQARQHPLRLARRRAGGRNRAALFDEPVPR